MNILVGVSGGVDSCVALNILKNQGHNVFGAIMKIYDGTVKTLASSCYGTDKTKEIKDAENICKMIGCDFRLIDLSKDYDEIIFKEFKKQYLEGLTPNPCIMCNKFIKFGLFPKKAKETGLIFDKFATGHYARNEFNQKTGRWELKKGIDPKKDQTYFLYKLSQDELKNILFPLGNMTKEQTRDYAKKNNLIPKDKQDSRDFYKGDYNDLFDLKPRYGNIVDKFGNILGLHNGIYNYTIGQRKGLNIAYKEPLYVLDIDKSTNSIIVGIKNDTYKKGLIANNINWVSIKKTEKPFEAQAKIRSAGEPKEVAVYPNDNEFKVEFKDKISSVAPGQSVVLYKNDTVLAGGIIKNSY